MVAGAGTYLSDVDVLTNITHTFCGDIDMTLTSPAGTIVTLTTDNGSSFDNVFNGTTSIGTIALSTSGTNVTASSGLLDSEVAALGQVSVKSLADATGTAQIVYEYEVQHDAVQS